MQVTDVRFGATSLTHNGRDTLSLGATILTLNGRLNWSYRYKKWYVYIIMVYYDACMDGCILCNVTCYLL